MREAVIRHLPEVDADGHVVDIFFLDGPERYEPLPNAAVLMAGGRGERLRPLTTDLPEADAVDRRQARARAMRWST